ncbi:hypothetical protein [Spiroplasma kunkelii]|nr:hypothetical protein [Spiroplasma kunkelii]
MKKIITSKIWLINILVIQQYQKAIINMKQQLCIVCINDIVWENGSRYCWNCVNKNIVLINKYYSRLDNGKE